MNLKLLALLAAIAETGKMGILIYYSMAYRSMAPLQVFQALLYLPAILFFFYVWKRQKP
jgi:hypothetical protein